MDSEEFGDSQADGRKNDIEMIETLFLIGQYQTAFDLSVKELDALVSVNGENFYLEPTFTSLVVVSLQSLSHLDGKILAFLKKYYNSLNNISYEVLYLSVNILVSKQRHTEAEELVFLALDLFEKESSRFSQVHYNKLVEILILHIYIPTNKLDSALKIIKSKSSFIQNSSFYREAVESQIEKNAEKVKSQEQHRRSPVKSPNSSPSVESISACPTSIQEPSDRKSSWTNLFQHLFQKIVILFKTYGIVNFGFVASILFFLFYKRNYLINLFYSIFPKPIEAKPIMARTLRVNK